ncbi:uncharacterized protein E5676_scaffold571G00270 [Cucumis melo var. makuwa]|uniref:Uncharacterized protein n=2 Tax=Cucumis melo TaxID=3656 RepID=A0A5A7V856_CUCMM|nr:uncharacterized protein E6C27_scaffold89G001110 [Cucumis melo var. makuwa]TYK15387.1 uncharacterized protein E5676_scaffold571G00270 [Cucumis melo var. makuwa]
MENELKPRLPKPPTRLQKQAPASLHLDQLSSVSMSSASNDTYSKAILPLLSPLPLSPQPLPEIDGNRISATGNAVEGGGGNGDQRGIGFVAPGGWQHPAVAATFPDPSTLFTFFQSQCIVSSNTP